MKPFRDLGIQNKMNLMTLVICGAVLLVATAALFTFQVWNFRTNFVQNETTLATITGDNSSLAVEVADSQGAKGIVDVIKSVPEVISATLVLTNGKVLASYGVVEGPASLAQFAHDQDARFLNGDLLVTHPIRSDISKELVGAIYVRSDYRHSLMNLLKFYGLMLVMVIVISICLGVLLSRRLSRTITDPVLELARTAKVVGEKKDYSVRAAGDKR